MEALPDKFAFVSHINECMKDEIYRAERDGNRYNITLTGEMFVWHSTVPEMRKYVSSGEYEIVVEF